MSTITGRREIAEYEAELYGKQEPSFLVKLLGLKVIYGEVEIKIFNNGEKLLEVELHGARVPNGGVVSAVIDGTPICKVEVIRGKGRVLQSTAQGHEIPEVNSESVAEIYYQGEVILRGMFVPD